MKINEEFFFLSGNGNYQLNAETLKILSELFGQSCIFKHINCNKFIEGELDNGIPQYEEIRDKTVVFFQSLFKEELFLEAIDFLWHMKYQYGAKRIIGVFPFMWNRRQDPKMEILPGDTSGKKAKPEEFQRLRMTISMLKFCGVDEMIVATPHSTEMSNACNDYGIVFHEADPSSLFAEIIKTFIPEKNRAMLAAYSPDAGSVPRAIRLAKLLNCPVLFSLKNRGTYNSISMANAEKEELQEKEKKLREENDFSEIYYASEEAIKDKIIIMVEDEAASCSTANKTGRFLKDKGARTVLFVVTHPVLTLGWKRNLFQDNPFSKIVMTNTIPRGYEKRTGGDIVDISVAPLIASSLFKILTQ